MKKLINECIEKVKGDLEGVCDDATPGATDCLSCFQRQYFDEDKVHEFKDILFENLSTNTDFESEDNAKHHCGFSMMMKIET